MTTEQPYAAPPVDTLREVENMKAAGVPEEHASAMLYAAIRTSDARVAELRRDTAELRRDTAELRRDMIARFEAADAKVAELRRDMIARFEAADLKFGAIDLKFDAINDRFEGVNGRFDGVADKVSAMRWRLAAVVSIASVFLAVLATSAPDIIAALR